MKLSVSRSSVLTTLVIVAIVLGIPFAVAEFFKTGQLYLFSRRFVDDLVARLHGPGRLRFILQPLTAIALGARDGKKDLHAGKPPFLYGLVSRNNDRAGLMRSAIVSTRDLVAVAILLDMIAQLLIFRTVHPGAALLLGPILIAIPYAASRAVTNRLARWRNADATIPPPEPERN